MSSFAYLPASTRLAPVLLAVTLSACSPTPDAESVPPNLAPETAAPAGVRWVMGTTLEIDIVGMEPAAADTAREAAIAEAQRWENLLSHYLPTSDLSRLNATAGAGVTRVGPDLRLYLERNSIDFERTHGQFDITVGPLVELYRQNDAPSAEARSNALARVGFGRLEFHYPDGVTLPEGARLDPGGDGKGVALDAMVRVLREHGVENAFVSFGRSSVYGMGTQADGSPWRWGILDPDGRPVGTVELRDQALSLSAAWFRPNPGAPRRGHIVDPRTGELVQAARHTVALSPSATDAEVLSTVCVLDGAHAFSLLSRFDGAQIAVFEEETPPFLTEGFQAVFTAAGD